ncbi:MAG: AEC family transporter [Abditibacteriaceae bacterium]
MNQLIVWDSFGPSFWLAALATAKVFAVGFAGFLLMRFKILNERGLRSLGQLVALLTMPCLVIYSFATGFDPATIPGWWVFALIGFGITVFGMALGKILAWRYDDEEATMLIGFQNAGYFVLPMLAALLPNQEYIRTSLLLFVLVIPFNTVLWFMGSVLLLRKPGWNPSTILTPPFVATVFSLIVYGLGHHWIHQFDGSFLVQILFGSSTATIGTAASVGAMQQIGGLTIPLAMLVLGGSIAANVQGKIEFKRAVAATTIMKLVIMPLFGYVILRFVMGPPTPENTAIYVLLMLQFCAPPGTNLTIFSQQYGYKMRLIPAVCLASYILCLLTVPFFVALVLR